MDNTYETATFKIKTKKIKTLKWIGKFIGFIPVSIIVLLLATGEFQKLQSGILNEVLPILIVLGIGVLGYLISWFSELIGGLIQVFGALAMIICFYLMLGYFQFSAIVMYPVPFLFSGILALYCWLNENRTGAVKSSPDKSCTL